MRWLLVTSCLALPACFNPQVDETSGDTGSETGGSAGSMTVAIADSGSTSGVTATGIDPTGSTSDTPIDGTTGSTTDTPTGDATDGTTGEPQLGPQLVMSMPANGDMQASLDGFFFLYFDRVVAPVDATGHILVSQGGAPAVPVSPLPCPPDNDPTCIAAVFPASFVDKEEGQLPGNTAHQITIEADFPDPDGMVNTLDQTVDFTTFDFTANVYDDSAFMSFEFGGMVYDPVGQNLYLAGVPNAGGSDCVLRRIPAPGGVLGAAETVATPTVTGGGPYCYGVDLYDGSIYLSMSYDGDVRQYTDLTGATLDASEVLLGPTTGLMAPEDNLDEVWSVAAANGRVFTGRGNFFGGPDGQAVLEVDAAGGWSIFQPGTNLWVAADSVVVATGVVGGVDVLFAHAAGSIFKFRLSDGVLIDQLDDIDSFAVHMYVDDAERLFVGTGGGLTIYNADDYTELASRPGIDCSRFAVVDNGDSPTVYFNRYREEPIIGRMTIEL